MARPVHWEKAKEAIIRHIRREGGRVSVHQVSQWDIRNARGLINAFPDFFPKWVHTARVLDCGEDEQGEWVIYPPEGR